MAELKAFDRPEYTNGWVQRHNKAVDSPVGFERSIVEMLEAWGMYAVRHKNRFDTVIGADFVLGPAWKDIGDAIRTMLNGDLGRLDAGTLDKFISDTMLENGFTEEEINA